MVKTLASTSSVKLFRFGSGARVPSTVKGSIAKGDNIPDESAQRNGDSNSNGGGSKRGESAASQLTIEVNGAKVTLSVEAGQDLDAKVKEFVRHHNIDPATDGKAIAQRLREQVILYKRILTFSTQTV